MPQIRLTPCSPKVSPCPKLIPDHFSCYLNEPAGQVAIVVVKHAVTQVVAAWSDPSVDPRRAIDSVMQVFCHPALLNRNSSVQMEMFRVVEQWANAMSPSDRSTMLEGLSKEGVRAGRHHDAKRNDPMGGHGQSGGHSHEGGFGGYMQQAQNKIPGYGYVQQAQGMLSGHGGGGNSHGVSGYVQQAQHMFGGSSGGGGIGGFVQNLAGQQMGRREINDHEDGKYAPPREVPPNERDDKLELDQLRNSPIPERSPEFPEQLYGGLQHGSSPRPYPYTPAVQPYPDDEEPLPGQRRPVYGQPAPGQYGQQPYGPQSGGSGYGGRGY